MKSAIFTCRNCGVKTTGKQMRGEEAMKWMALAGEGVKLERGEEYGKCTKCGSWTEL